MFNKNTTLPELVSYNHLLEIVLDRFDLDYDGKQKTLEYACQEKSIHADFLMEILRTFDNGSTFSASRLSAFPLTVILDYLVRTHHYYLDKRLLEIEQTLDQLISRHKDGFPLLSLLKLAFSGYRNELVEHIQLEENKLFPYIHQLLQTARAGELSDETKSIPDQYSTSRFIQDHDDDPENRLHEIREAIIKYHPRVKNLMSFRVLLNQLDAFEKDLTIHGRIEDEVLIPKVQLLEQKLRA